MMRKHPFTEDQVKAIQGAIATAEMHTSGEIRIHVARRCKNDPFQEAVKVFDMLKMHQTEQRNGVLFFISLKDQKLAIIGDKGINEKVSENFWDDIRDMMINHFKQQQFAEGLVNGILAAGEQLKATFPYHSDDTNELSNEISYEG
jgi:uncharacterized membrane protein